MGGNELGHIAREKQKMTPQILLFVYCSLSVAAAIGATGGFGFHPPHRDHRPRASYRRYYRPPRNYYLDYRLPKHELHPPTNPETKVKCEGNYIALSYRKPSNATEDDIRDNDLVMYLAAVWQLVSRGEDQDTTHSSH